MYMNYVKCASINIVVYSCKSCIVKWFGSIRTSVVIFSIVIPQRILRFVLHRLGQHSRSAVYGSPRGMGQHSRSAVYGSPRGMGQHSRSAVYGSTHWRKGNPKVSDSVLKLLHPF